MKEINGNGNYSTVHVLIVIYYLNKPEKEMLYLHQHFKILIYFFQSLMTLPILLFFYLDPRLWC